MLLHVVSCDLTVSVRIISISISVVTDGDGNELDGEIDRGGGAVPLVPV